MDNLYGSAEPAENAEAQKQRDLVVYWLAQINDSLKREKEWRVAGRKCVRMYEAKTKMKYNILYSNTETLNPAIYSATPKPAVMRRYKNDADVLAKAGAEVLNRSLTYMMDTNGDSCGDFDDLMEGLVIAALVPGRGQVWYSYDAEIQRIQEEDLSMLEERVTGVTEEKWKPVERVKEEYIKRSLVPWDRYTQGYGRQFEDVPWVARCHAMTKGELKEKWPDLGGLVKCSTLDEVEEDKGGGGESKEDKEGAPSVAMVWEVWDKTTKKVWFVTEGYRDAPLEATPDPLKLSGFFPCPKPLSFTKQLSGLIPQTLYSFYQEQAEELEVVTSRLKGLIRAMRIRGMYNGLMDDIAKVLDAEENTMMPITNAAVMDGNGLQDSVWMIPIDKYVSVIQELWTQREQLKKVIYEITGVSDIIRGSTVASETATAQDIKNRWGTLRLQSMQKRVQKFARTMLRLEAELMCLHFDQKKFMEMTDLDYPTNEQKMQVQQALQQTQMPGQEPQQPDPKLLEIMKTPSWEDVLGFLKSSMLRMYRLDIESDSTLADEVKSDQEELTKLLQGATQLIQGLTPAVQGGFLSFDTAKAILIGVCRRFRLGSDLETAFESAVKPPPPQEDQGKEKAAALAAQQQQQQMEQQRQMQEQQMQQQAEDRKLDFALKQQEVQVQMQALQQELEFKKAEHQMKMQELVLKAQLAEKQVLGKLATIDAQTEAARVKSQEVKKGE